MVKAGVTQLMTFAPWLRSSKQSAVCNLQIVSRKPSSPQWLVIRTCPKSAVNSCAPENLYFEHGLAGVYGLTETRTPNMPVRAGHLNHELQAFSPEPT